MKNTRRVLLYSPYLDTFGGGERHYLSIIKVFDEKNYSIDIAWDGKNILGELEEKMQLKFKNVSIISNFFKKNNFFSKALKTLQYDILIYVTDGSYFFSLAKKNYIFTMVPQKDLYQRTIKNILKWANVTFVSNSQFTAGCLKKWSIKSLVLYPSIDALFLKPVDSAKKEPIVLSVGRFFSYLHSKKQKEIIRAFIEFKQKNILFKNFKLYLVGRLKNEDIKYFNDIKKLTEDRKDIILSVNLKPEKLLELYRKSSLYWHFAGLGQDGVRNPQQLEHLGMAPMEAMASGCIVFAYNGGGIGEVVKNGETGFTFDSISDFNKKMTDILPMQDLDLMRERARSFVIDNFSYDRFTKRVEKIFNI